MVKKDLEKYIDEAIKKMFPKRRRRKIGLYACIRWHKKNTKKIVASMKNSMGRFYEGK